MRILKKILLVLAILIAIPLVIALFVKNEYVVERTTNINRPAATVFDYVRYLKNQDAYSKWVRTDPAMQKQFRGTDGTAGFVYAWDGNNEAGAGEQEIRKLVPNREVACEIRFKRPMEGLAYTRLQTEAVAPAQTKVTWRMEGRNAYPFNFMNLLIDRLLGNDIDSSLYLLKTRLEK